MKKLNIRCLIQDISIITKKINPLIFIVLFDFQYSLAKIDLSYNLQPWSASVPCISPNDDGPKKIGSYYEVRICPNFIIQQPASPSLNSETFSSFFFFFFFATHTLLGTEAKI